MVYDYEYFKKFVYDLTKINLDFYKENQMKRRIDALILKNGIKGYDVYANALKTNKDIFEEFINYITINVSEFYRNPDQWAVMEKNVIPNLIENFGENLKIWSAACSTGDEPYSLVMLLSKFMPFNKIRITATDLDKTILGKAKVGLYNEKSLAGLPKEFKDKYFTQVGGSFQICDEIKSRVDFKEHNLLRDPYMTNYNMIVCRNVLIYFTEEAKDDVFRKFYNSLAPGGILFIGSTEQIINYKEIGFERFGGFFYQKPKV